MSLITLLITLAVPFLLFIPHSHRKARYASRTFVDKYIPLIPTLIVPYLSFLILVPLSLIYLVPSVVGQEYLVALNVAMWSGFLVWALVPTGLTRPHVHGRDVFSAIVRAMYRVDGPTNNFPSSHVFVSLITAHYLAIISPGTALITWAWFLLVAASTVFVKQHYALDILGGIVWAVVSITIAQLLIG